MSGKYGGCGRTVNFSDSKKVSHNTCLGSGCIILQKLDIFKSWFGGGDFCSSSSIFSYHLSGRRYNREMPFDQLFISV